MTCQWLKIYVVFNVTDGISRDKSFLHLGGYVDIRVLDFELCPSKKKIGNVLVQYCDLVMKCELVYHPEDKRVWVRMPEVWLTKKSKFKYCFWPVKEVSDEFQKEVLKQVFEKYKMSDANVAHTHQVNAKIRHEKQK